MAGLRSPGAGFDKIRDFGISNTGPSVYMQGGPPVSQGLQELPIDQLTPFHSHHFPLYEGEKLADLVRSISENGIWSPVLVRPWQGKYEILSGHNRVNAARIAGIATVPVRIMDNIKTEAEATLVVTESNLLQRSFDELSYRERAAVIKEHFDAMKEGGRRKELLKEVEDAIQANAQGEEIVNPLGVRTVGKEYGLSKDTVARYLRVATLEEGLKSLLDNEKLPLKAAVALSYVEPKLQTKVCEIMQAEKAKPMDEKLAKKVRQMAETGCDLGQIRAIMLKQPKAKKDNGEVAVKVVLSLDELNRWGLVLKEKKELEVLVKSVLVDHFDKESTKSE